MPMSVDLQRGRAPFDLGQRHRAEVPDVAPDIDAVAGAELVLMDVPKELQAVTPRARPCDHGIEEAPRENAHSLPRINPNCLAR